MKIDKTEAATQREIKIMDVLNVKSTSVACGVIEKEDRSRQRAGWEYGVFSLTTRLGFYHLCVVTISYPSGSLLQSTT